ncbi:MAG: O-antigen ligase family protein, partial [Patescibacteria group bacterium]
MNAGDRKNRSSPAVYRIIIFISLLLNVAVLFIAQTRGDILGLGFGFMVLVFLFSLRPPDVSLKIFASRKLYVFVLALIVVSGAAFWFTRNSGFWENVPGLSRFRDISFSLSDKGLQPRLIAIRAAWKGFLDKPLSGWGWENFNIVFNKYYDPRALELSYQETRFDKPHNFIMEDLVSGGAFLLLARLTLMVLLVFAAGRLKNRLALQFTVSAVAAYFVRSVFIFDTLGPALMFYLLLGFIDGKYTEVNIAQAQAMDGERRSAVKTPALIVVAVVSLFVIYRINVSTLMASRYEFFGFTKIAHGDVSGGIENFHKSLDLWSPYRWNFARDFAAAISEAYFYNPEVISREEAIEGIREMERVAREHPK